jgi:hypothetical protein
MKTCARGLANAVPLASLRRRCLSPLFESHMPPLIWHLAAEATPPLFFSHHILFGDSITTSIHRATHAAGQAQLMAGPKCDCWINLLYLA